MKNDCKSGRITALTLVALLLIPLFIGCTDEGNKVKTDETTTAVKSTEAETTELLPELPQDANYEGYDFRVLARGKEKWLCQDMYAETLNAEAVNDAVFMRNSKVEEQFNFKISQKLVASDGALLLQIRKSLQAGDHDFDLLWVGAIDIATLSTEGLLYEFSDLPYVNLRNPWWDQKAVDNMSINGHTYYTTGDICIIDNQSTYVISFNKATQKKLNLADPYELVREGKWTMDRFTETAKQAYSDLDGNGAYSTTDSFGFMTYNCDTFGFMYAAGGSVAVINGSEITTNIYNDNIDSMMTKLMNLRKTDSSFFFSSDSAANTIFVEGRTLYSFRTLINLAAYRDIETDFGILPMPKLNEEQSNYYCGVHARGVSFIGVPVNCENPDRTGAILESLVYESVDTLTPAYYDIVLNGRYFRDEQSGEMLDIIFASRIYDLGYFCDWGGIIASMYAMSAAETNMLATIYASKENLIKASIEETIKVFNKQ